MRQLFSSLLILLATAGPVLAQQNVIRPDVVETLSGSRNYVLNPSATRNTVGTSVSSATIARDTDAGDRLDGVASFLCDSSAQNGHCQWNLATINSPDDVGNCEARVWYKGDATLYQLAIFDGTTQLALGGALQNVSTWTPAAVTYPCGASRSVRLLQTAVGNGAAVNVGRVYYGPAVSTAALNQSKVLLQARRITSNLAIGTNAETAVVFNDAPIDPFSRYNASTGVYTVPEPGIATVSVNLGMNNVTPNTSSQYVRVRKNGATQLGCEGFGLPTNGVFAIELTPCSFSVVAGDTIDVTTASDSDTSYNILATFSNVRIELRPGLTFTALNPSQFNYDWLAYTPTFTGFGTVTSPECQHKRDGADLLLRCKFTSGTPTATEARVSLPGSLVAAGTDRIPSIQKAGDFARGVSAASSFSFHILQEPSVSYVTFGVQGSAAAGMTKVLGNALVGSAEVVSFTARVPIAGWIENQGAPQLVGTVFSGTSGMERVERARVGGSASDTSNCTTTPCTIHRQSGSWLTSVSRSAQGSYTGTIASGVFSSTPSCIGQSANGLNTVVLQSPATSPTSITVVATNSTNAAGVDAYFDLICMGPR